MNPKTQIEAAFEKLAGESTDKERQELYKIKDALGLDPHDAVWMVLMALQYHHRLYEKIPAEIDAASKEAAKTAATRAQAQVSQAVAQLVPTVQAGVERAAVEAVRRIEIKDWIGSMFIGAILLAAILVIGMTLGHAISASAAASDLPPWTFAVKAGSFAALAMLAAVSILADYASGRFGGSSAYTSSAGPSLHTVLLCIVFAVPVLLHVLGWLFAALPFAFNTIFG